MTNVLTKKSRFLVNSSTNKNLFLINVLLQSDESVLRRIKMLKVILN